MGIMENKPDTIPQPTQRESLTDAERNLYSIDALKEWRDHQTATRVSFIMDGLVAGKDVDTLAQEFTANSDNMLKSYMEEQGLLSDGDSSPNYDEVIGLFEDASIEKISESNWYISTVDQRREAVSSPRDVFAARIAKRLGAENQENDPDEERTPEIIEKELDEARINWARMQAKRQGRFWNRRIDGYKETREQYEKLQREYGVATLEPTFDDDTEESDKNIKVLEYIFAEQNKLRVATKEAIDNTKISKFVEKFGGWLNEGDNKWKKFGKSVGFGLGTSLVGAGAGFLFGTIGTGAAVVGGATVAAKMTMRFAKSFAKSDNAKNRGVELLDNDTQNQWRQSVDMKADDFMGEAILLSRSEADKSTKKEERKRRETVAIAVGGLALGATMGAVVSDLAADHFIGGHSPSSSPTAEEAPSDGPSGGAEDPSGGGDGDPNPDPDVGDTGPEVDESDPLDTPEEIAESFSSDAGTIEYGEGGWNTLSEMGIDSRHYEEAWEAVGQRLNETGHGDLVYRMADGRWGWSRPGALDEDTLTIVADVLQSDYGLTA